MGKVVDGAREWLEAEATSPLVEQLCAQRIALLDECIAQMRALRSVLAERAEQVSAVGG